MVSATIHNHLHINSYGSYLRKLFGCRVSKVNVDGGFTCPNRDGNRGIGGCVYCDPASFSPGATLAEIPIETQMAEGMAYHRKRLGSEKFIVYFQKFTNTYGPVQKLKNLYGRALAHPDVVGVSVGTRPDALADDAIDLLSELAQSKYVCLELGLQSMDDVILQQINCGHTLSDYLQAVERVTGRGIDICTHLIHGFPGESHADFMKTARLISSLPINSLKIHQLHAVKGTRLAQWYLDGRFIPLTHEHYVAAVCDFLEQIPSEISIQRLYGSAPLAIRVAPNWNLKNNQMWFSVVNELKRRGTWQGCRLVGHGRSVCNL